MVSKRTKSFFFFLIFTLCAVQIINFSPYGHSAEFDINTPIVEANWLYVDIGAFQDSSPHEWENDIHFVSGGEDLISFDNLGVISYSENEILYGSKARFGFEVSAHTSVGVLDAFPNLDINAMVEIPYLWVSNVNWAGTCFANYRYDAKWKYAALGSLHLHEYVGTAPVTVGIKPLSSTSGNLTLNGVTFDIPEYAVNVMQTEVMNVRDGEIGTYTPEFKNIADSQTIEVSFAATKESPTSQPIIDYLNDHNIGVDATAIPRAGATYVQSEVGGDQIGATYHNPNPVENRFYTFGLGTNIVPDVYNYIQTVTVTQVSIGVHYPLLSDPYLVITYGPKETDYERIVGAYTQNYFMYWNLEVEVYFYATVQTTAALTEKILSDPYLKFGDWVWDTSIMGGKVDIIFETEPWWNRIFGGLINFIIFIIVMVFVIIGLYIFIKIGIPAIRSRQRKKEYAHYRESAKNK